MALFGPHRERSNMEQLLARETYDRFVARSPQGSVFCTSWWLETVAPGAHQILRVERNGVTVAAWPVITRRTRLGGNTISMAPLTPYLGILYGAETPQKLTHRLSDERELTDALVAQLPPFGGLYVSFHRNFTYWLPLFWHGFKQTTWYTYVLPDISDLDRVWQGFRENIRRDIRKAQKGGVRVETTDDLDLFLDIHERTFSRQGLRLPYSRDLVHSIDRACRLRAARRIFVGHGPDGRPHAAVYLVWDERTAYYLMGGGDPDLRQSGATALVMWEAIQFASTVVPEFDFEGSMIEPVERFFRAFGGQPCPHFVVSKVQSPIRLGFKALLDIVYLMRRPKLRGEHL